MYEERKRHHCCSLYVSMSRGGLLEMLTCGINLFLHLPRCCTVLGLNKASEEDIYAALCYYLARHKTLISNSYTSHIQATITKLLNTAKTYRSTQIISQMKLFLIKVLVLALTTGEDVHAQAQDSDRPVTSLRGSVVSRTSSLVAYLIKPLTLFTPISLHLLLPFIHTYSSFRVILNTYQTWRAHTTKTKQIPARIRRLCRLLKSLHVSQMVGNVLQVPVVEEVVCAVMDIVVIRSQTPQVVSGN